MANQKIAYMHGLDHMIIKEGPIPEPKEGEVLVSLEYVGICGSDGHYFHTGACGSFKVDLSQDFILGHECAGTVTKLGKGVTTLKVGDRVALEPGITCGQCEFCKSGHYNLCPDVIFLATPPVQGCNMEYIAFPANMCFKLPDNISTKEGALVEPLSVGFYASQQGDVRTGDSVLIFGAGCIGLVTLLSCKAAGAGNITVIDREVKRLNKAKELGATNIINNKEVDALEEAKKITDGKLYDKVFECCGTSATVQLTPYYVKNGGTVTLVGIAPEEMISYNFGQVMAKEITIKSVFRYRNIFPKAIAAMGSGAINVKGIVTHEFPFDQIEKGYNEAINNKTDLIKAVIKIK